MQNNEFIAEISPHTIWEACEAVFVQLFMAGNKSEVIRKGNWGGEVRSRGEQGQTGIQKDKPEI